MLVGKFGSICQEYRTMDGDPPYRRLKPTVIKSMLCADTGSGEIETSQRYKLPSFVSISPAYMLAIMMTQFPAALAAGGGVCNVDGSYLRSTVHDLFVLARCPITTTRFNFQSAEDLNNTKHVPHESEASGRWTKEHLPPACETYVRLPEANVRSSVGQRPRTRYRHSIKRCRASGMVTQNDKQFGSPTTIPINTTLQP